MAMSNGFFGPTLRDMLDATQLAVNVDSDSFKQQLHNNTVTPDYTVWDFRADLTNEITGTNYTAGGALMSGETITIAAGVMTLDAADTEWLALTASGIRGRFVYDDTLANDPLLLGTSFGNDYQVTAGTFRVQEQPTGLWTVTYV